MAYQNINLFKSMIRKKLKILAVILIFFLIGAEILAVMANNFFFEKVSATEVKKRSMPAITSNSVKHAYASSLLYSGLRKLYFSKDSAKNITIFLGKLNEIAEVIFKPNQDSSLEMMKDLTNNVLGICAANWIEENSGNPLSLSRLEFIGFLAESKILILLHEDLPLISDEEKAAAKKSFEYSLAKKWFNENEEKIICDF